mmetsp:Transcript_181446/g.575965  ORF Transcript_181446/g.575965 Transcript_181446/m.575965 type:complete len:289 (-) Transcript_181446:7-873(-)
MRADGLQRPIGYPSQTLCLGRPYDDGLDHFADVAKYNTSKSQPSEVGCRITCIRPLRVSREAANCQTERTNAQHATLQDEVRSPGNECIGIRRQHQEGQQRAADGGRHSPGCVRPPAAPQARHPIYATQDAVGLRGSLASAGEPRRAPPHEGARQKQRGHDASKSQKSCPRVLASNISPDLPPNPIRRQQRVPPPKPWLDSPEDRVIKVHSLHVRTEQVLALPSRRPPNWLHNGVESDRGDVVVDLVERPALSVASAFLGRLFTSKSVYWGHDVDLALDRCIGDDRDV